MAGVACYLWVREFILDVGVNIFGVGDGVADASDYGQLQVVISKIRAALDDGELLVFVVELHRI